MKKIIALIIFTCIILNIFAIDILVNRQYVVGTLKYSEYKTKELEIKNSIIADQDSIITVQQNNLNLKDQQLQNNKIQIDNLKQTNKILLQLKSPVKHWYENPTYILPIGFIIGVGSTIGIIQSIDNK